MPTETERMSEATLLRLLPPIRRARGWRLYAEDGRRFLDLWQEGGRALLGAKGTGLGTEIKAAVDKGLAKPFPSIHERRLEKELLALHPDYEAVRFYSSLDAALAALASAFPGVPAEAAAAGQAAAGASSGAAVPDPGAFREAAVRALLADPWRRGEPAASARAIVLRPFGRSPGRPVGEAGAPVVQAEAAAAQAGAVRPEDYPAALAILPCPGPFAPHPLLFARKADAERAGGELLSPLSLIAGRRSLVELRGYAKNCGEELWRRADRRTRRLFEREGPLLYPRCAEADYPALFRAALGKGLLLSVDWSLPSLLPGDFDDGELKPLAEL